MKICTTIFLIHIHCILFAQGLRYVEPIGFDTSECGNPDYPCRTITYAIGQANPNDTIRISEGVFTEPDGITIDKSIVLQGAGKSITILQAHTEPEMATSRVVTIDGEYQVSIIGTTIRHGYLDSTGSFGGGIYCDSAILILEDVMIYKNSAERYGGGLYSTSSTLTFSGVDFEENFTNGDIGGGGGLYVAKSKGSFMNLSVSNNSTGFNGRGGGLRIVNSIITMDYSGISQNFAASGGGIYARSGNILLSNSFLLENTSTFLGGGGIDTEADTLNIANTIISGNRTDAYGGGVALSSGFQEFSNVDVRNNSASSLGGGGIYNNNCKPKFENVRVDNNFSYGNGGGMVNWVDMPFTLTGITFRFNEARQFGGGLYQIGDSSIIKGVLFQQNTAEMGGGLCPAGEAFVEHCTFLKNHSTRDGGGISFEKPLHLSDISFIENTAEGGGGGLQSNGTFSEHKHFDLHQVLFRGNSAPYGGGIVNGSFSYPILESVVFDSNSAEYGGGFYNSYGTPVFSNVLFENNTAFYGGGLYHFIDTVTAINTVFARNIATTAGGAIYNSGDDGPVSKGKIRLINVTMSRNSSPMGGGIYNFNSHSDILNSVIWKNEGDQGKNIFNDSTSSAALRFSLCGDSLTEIVEGSGIDFFNCLHDDPLFVDTDDYRLTKFSPCINSGDVNTDTGIFPGGPDDPVDYDLNPRIINSGIDMGAFENQEMVAVKQDDPERLINLYPNPASNSFFITGNEKINRIRIFNLSGQVVLENLVPGSFENHINISSLVDGMYFVLINLEKSQFTYKLLKNTVL